jgi:hypothetical protein
MVEKIFQYLAENLTNQNPQFLIYQIFGVYCAALEPRRESLLTSS